MVALNRVRSQINGLSGGPGVCTHYCLDVATFLPRLATFWTSLVDYIPNSVSVAVQPSGDIIESTTGELTGAWTAGAQTDKLGLSTGGFAAPAGICISWHTGTVLSGRRLRGRTFVVPISSASYDVQGSILTASLTAMRAAATGLATLAPPNFSIWQRPVEARPADGSRPAVAARGGGHAVVTSATVADKVAILTSRRG